MGFRKSISNGFTNIPQYMHKNKKSSHLSLKFIFFEGKLILNMKNCSHFEKLN